MSCNAIFVENNQVLEITCDTAEGSQTIIEVQYSLNGVNRGAGIYTLISTTTILMS